MRSYLLDAFSLSQWGVVFGFAVAIRIVESGFFLCRQGFKAFDEIRTAVQTGSPKLLFALLLPVMGAVAGAFSVLGLVVLSHVGRVADGALVVIPPLGWTIGGAILVPSVGVFLALLPQQKTIHTAIRFIEEVVWFADLITFAILSFTRQTTLVALYSVAEVVRLFGVVSPTELWRAVRRAASRGVVTTPMASELEGVGEMARGYLSRISADLRVPDLVKAFQAISHLDSLGWRAPDGVSTTLAKLDADIFRDHGNDLGIQRLVWFATGTHGHAGLKFLGAIPYGSVRTDNEAMALCAGIPVNDILLSEWSGELMRPGYCLAVVRGSGCLVLSLRGSLFPQDAVTDLVCLPEACVLAGVSGYAHEGMLAAARRLSKDLSCTIVDLLDTTYAGHKLVVTGHSLGAGVGALLTALWLNTDTPLGTHADSLRCVGYGMPAVTSPNIAKAIASRVTSVVCGRDAVPCLSLDSCTRVRDAVLRVYRRGNADTILEERDVTTARALANKLRQSKAIVLCPPGRVMWAPVEPELGLVEVDDPVEAFRDLPLTASVYATHLPQKYARRFGEAFGRAEI